MFNYDNKVFEFINRMVDTIFVALLWVVFSLPIITIGASTTAFYETVHKVLCQNKGYVWRTFWNTFRSNFKRSTIVWLIQFGLSLFFVLDMLTNILIHSLTEYLVMEMPVDKVKEKYLEQLNIIRKGIYKEEVCLN